MTEPQQGDPPAEQPEETNPPRPELVYPDGAPEDTNGPVRVVHPPAQRGGDGQWLDPDTGMPVGFPLDDPPTGEMWSTQDIRDKRTAWEALGPALPTEPPALTEQERADQGEGVFDIVPDARTVPQTPGNLDDQSRPHFLRTVSGVEVCGQDGDPWPCATWSRWVQEQEVPTAAPIPDGAIMTTTDAARALGVDPNELAAFVASRNRS
jgi:hypothetical protein